MCRIECRAHLCHLNGVNSTQLNGAPLSSQRHHLNFRIEYSTHSHDLRWDPGLGNLCTYTVICECFVDSHVLTVCADREVCTDSVVRQVWHSYSVLQLWRALRPSSAVDAIAKPSCTALTLSIRTFANPNVSVVALYTVNGIADSLGHAAAINHWSWPRDLIFVLWVADSQVRAVPITQLSGLNNGKLLVFQTVGPRTADAICQIGWGCDLI